MLPNQTSAPLTVSQLNRQVKQLLESQYPLVPVQGEISTLSKPASGHIYFTLKDSSAQIRCAMFKGQLTRNRYIPKQGDEVLVFGRLSLYEGRGDYQLIASSMQPVGEGALQAAFFQMKERLANEGLFAEEHKKPLPDRIARVGVVTSSTGAAFHDILTVLNRRFPAMEVILYPSQVQGNEATATIVQAIETANQRREVDILIVGRGGGSLEDLWCFNTEPVARAIFASELPVISAVGHEVDVSISDFVADLRAATPSQAAELISPDQYELMQVLDQHERRLLRAMNQRLQFAGQQVIALSNRLRSPAELVGEWRTKLASLQNRLNHAISRPLAQQHQQLEHLQRRLALASPERRIAQDKQQLNLLQQRLNRAIDQTVQPKRSAFGALVAKLQLLSPLSTLERGYSISRDANQRVVSSVRTLSLGDEMETLVADGKLYSTVNRIEPDN